MQQDHLRDEELGQENENVCQGRPENNAGKRYRAGQMGKTEMPHHHCSYYHRKAVDQISDDDCLLVVEEEWRNYEIEQAEDKWDEVGWVRGHGMNPEMKHPPAQGQKHKGQDWPSDFPLDYHGRILLFAGRLIGIERLVSG